VKAAYQDAYLATVRIAPGDVDKDLHAEVLKELVETNWQDYKKITGDPAQDARLNYDRGLAKVLKKRHAESAAAPNVRGDQKNAPTGLSSGSRVEGPPKKKIELDEFAKKYIAAYGSKEDDEWVQESLSKL
jgi:hypothetical protein